MLNPNIHLQEAQYLEAEMLEELRNDQYIDDREAVVQSFADTVEDPYNDPEYHEWLDMLNEQSRGDERDLDVRV